MIAEEEVVQMYQLVLGRDPENSTVVANHAQAGSLQALLWVFLRSEEFLGRYRVAIRRTFNV